MKLHFVPLIVMLLACSSNKKDVEKKRPSFSQACIELIKNTKIKAPPSIEYQGLFSSLEKNSAGKPQGVIIRIVKHQKDCSALVLEYDGNTQPSKWSYSEKFECDLSNLTLVSRTAFKNPYNKELPIINDFTFKGHVLANGDLKGAIISEPTISPQKPEVQAVTLKKMPADEFDMASFDWETIELMRLKSRCR